MAMASESTEEETVTVSLPAELDDWLDERAGALDTDRETVLVQLLAAYRATAELDGDGGVSTNGQIPVAETQTIEETVKPILAETLDDRVEATVQSEVQSAVQAVVDGRIEAVEADYMEKIEDVRERVVQLKRELEGKAATDHDHPTLDRVDDLADQLDDIGATVDSLEDDVDRRLTEQEVLTEDLAERLDSVEDRLKTVAWVVSDLREAHESNGVEAVDRIKQAAAKANIDHANCENCGDTVSIGLLTEPNCPHCQATVTNVEAASGFFGKPRLLTASQLESGEGR